MITVKTEKETPINIEPITSLGINLKLLLSFCTNTKEMPAAIGSNKICQPHKNLNHSGSSKNTIPINVKIVETRYIFFTKFNYLYLSLF